ncbi:hypothetical protein BB561_000192 [Smittium simulii]|uniref:Protoporphyrinogen oxidase n=1 Tax=Smittium simulii TaxID=133385 RepID=A0A2T9Z010_9FUNG|nr:hypothetical protein BB561_000192 [Smittium simulii]
MSITKIQKTSSSFTILGGGIAGLTTAYNLCKKLPHASKFKKPTITVVEASDRLGGWIKSDKHKLSNGLDILCEKGPRTLRLDGGRESMAMLELIDDLGIHDQVIFTPKSSPASTNRFVYYNKSLNSVPSKPIHIFSRISPAVRPVFRALFNDLLTKKNTPTDKTDESVAQLLERRFGKKIDDCLSSAILAGIYGADSNKLSARMVLNRLWKADRLHGKVSTGINKAVEHSKNIIGKDSFLISQLDIESKDWKTRYNSNADFWQKVHSSSVLSFVDGIQTLSDAIYNNIKSQANIKIITQDPCVKINRPLSSQNTVSVKLQSGLDIESGKVVNTVPLHQSKSFFENEALPKILTSNEYSSICLVNLTYQGKGICPVDGFGFLVPRDSWEEIGIIGVVFDSCCLPGQDRGSDITRFTVMMGGPTYEKMFKSNQSIQNDNLVSIATRSIKKALGITADPIHVDSSVLEDCIPLFSVNYHEQLAEYHTWLQSWNGSLFVTGAAFGGPGINPIILHAKDAATQLLSDLNIGSFKHNYDKPFTGLDVITKLY